MPLLSDRGGLDCCWLEQIILKSRRGMLSMTKCGRALMLKLKPKLSLGYWVDHFALILMCQAVSLHPCSPLVCVFFLRDHWGLRRATACLGWHKRFLFFHIGNTCTRWVAYKSKLREEKNLTGISVAANILHMEGMASPCKMSFPSCVSLVLMMMNLSVVSLTSLFSLLCICHTDTSLM